jgi:rfaE bifunctional protein kinase chain/domain
LSPRNDLSSSVRQFEGKRILIVGDLCLSRFQSGRTVRFGHEAPTLVLRHEEARSEPGWIGHVAAGVRTLGGDPVPVGLIGDDPAGEELIDTLKRHEIDTEHILVSPGRCTPAIQRIYAGGHNTNRRQVLRIHYDERSGISREEENRVLERIEALMPRVEAVYLNHHPPGIATRKVWMALHDGARKRRLHTVVDSGRDPYAFLGPTVLIQSEYEMVEVLREPEIHTPGEAAVLARNIQRRAESQAAVLTRGNQGMVVVDGRKKPVQLGIYGPGDIVDSTGVGETVGAVIALALAAEVPVVEAARLASYAGGLAVMKPWLSLVSAAELEEASGSRAL